MDQLSHRSVVSPKALGLLVVACTVAAWLFVPDQQELVTRLDKDGHVDRLRALAQEAVAELQQTPETPRSDVERMRGWIREKNAELRQDPAVVADKKILCAITETPAEVGAELMSAPERVDAELLEQMIDALARRALGLQRPAEAGRLLSFLNARQPSWELTNRAMEAWRWGVRSDEALKELDAALKRGLDPHEGPQDIEALRIQLALESNQPNIAFDIVEQQYQRAPLTSRPALLHRLLELANAGDRTTEAARLINAYLATLTFHTCTIDQALAMISKGVAFANKTQEAEYREYAMSVAHWAEWSGHGDKAIDTWLRLSLIGSNEAWERSLDLYEDVLREEDFSKVLAFRISKGLSTDKQLLLANLLVDQGRTEEALTHYAAAAKRMAESSLAVRAMARIHQQMGSWAESMTEFAKVLEALPEDLEAGKGRAFALVRLHRYQEAADAYVAISKVHPEDADVQEICAGLCDSLGMAKEAREASQRLLDCAGHESTPEEHLELADQCRMAGDVVAETSTLRKGFAKWPTSLRMRMTLAECLADQDIHDEAMQLLAHESLRENGQAMDLLISEGMESGHVLPVAEFLGGKLPNCLDDLPETRLRLAFLFERVNRMAEASGIVNQLLHSAKYRQSETWMALAKLSFDAGDSLRAESFMTLYLESVSNNNPKAWELLGDIYQSQERSQEAVAAYRKAVEVLRPSVTTSTGERPLMKVSQTIGLPR